MTEVLAAFAFFLFVMGAVVAAGWVMLQPRAEPAGAAKLTTDSADPNPAREPKSVLGKALESLGRVVPAAHRERNPLRGSLAAAGYNEPSALPAFYGVRFASAVAGAAMLTIASTITHDGLRDVLAPMVGGAGIAYFAPGVVLRRLIRARRDRLRRALPTALDLCVLSIEAGHGLDQAILDTSRGLRRSYRDLSSEFHMVSMETRTGNDRAEALRNLAERTGEPEIRKVAMLLADADRFGAGIAPALRNHARYLRIRTRQRAQEAARKIAVKLIFPVFFLIFPSVLLVTLGPAFIMVMTQLRAAIP